MNGQLKQAACSWSLGPMFPLRYLADRWVDFGRMTAALARAAMTHAATASAGPAKAHTMHSKHSCESRFARSTCPQARHVCDVWRGSTSTTGTPTPPPSYSTEGRHSANGQLAL